MLRILFISAILCFSSLAMAEKKVPKKAKPAAAKTVAKAVTPTLTFTNIQSKGKIVWLPVSTQVIPGKYSLVLKNTLAVPHGFEIKGLVKPTVVPANGTKTVIVDAKKGDYKVTCQLHPAHVGALLIVK